jgi:hypothetical protein
MYPAQKQVMPQRANFLCALHKFCLTLAQINLENGHSVGTGRREYFRVVQERHPIEPAKFSASLPILRTSDGDHGSHTRGAWRQHGIH